MINYIQQPRFNAINLMRILCCAILKKLKKTEENKMKKLSVLMAALAAVTMTVSSGYADIPAYAKNSKPVTETAENKTEMSAALKGEIKVKTDFKVTKAILVTDDRVYYTGNNRGRNVTVFSTDHEGNIKDSLEIKSDLKDENGAFSTYGETMKQVGDHIYFFYTATPYFELNLPETGEWVAIPDGVVIPKPQSFKCVKLDKELNIIDEFELKDYTKSTYTQDVDINSTKIAYIKSGRKIYTVNHDGSGKKLLYTAGDEGLDMYHINSIAMNEDFIGFMGQRSRGTHTVIKGSDGSTVYQGDPDYIYCGIIDLKTGELTLEENDGAAFAKAYGSIITWNDSSTEAWSGKNGRIYTYDGKKFGAVKTKTAYESYYHAVDNEGRIIGYDIRGNTVQVYENGKLKKEVTVNDKNNEQVGFVNFTANNGVAAITYTDTKSGTTCKVKLIAY